MKAPNRRPLLAASLLLGVAGLLAFLLAEPPKPAAKKSYTFDQWMMACAKLPTNREMFGAVPDKKEIPLKNFSDVTPQVSAFVEQCQKGRLAEAARWLGKKPADDPFYNPARSYSTDPKVPFQPFAQRRRLPAGSEVIFHGDLHGDIHSLNASLKHLNKLGYLKGFKIAKPNTHMAFLGDYTDRGVYGVEVIYVLMRLKLANPNNVWLVRGNHEDFRMIQRYGFDYELVRKYGDDYKLEEISRLYDFLPVVLYLGCGRNYVQCNHGGMEPGYDPSALLAAPGTKDFQLLGDLKRLDFLHAKPEFRQMVPRDSQRYLQLLYQNVTPTSPTDPDLMGFMWADFAIQTNEPALRWDDTRPGWKFGKAGTKVLLDHASSKGPKLRAVIRAHQHSSQLNMIMRRLIAGNGVFRHWQKADTQKLAAARVKDLREPLESEEVRKLVDGAVYTLNVSPDSRYGEECGYDFDTVAIVKVANRFEDWQMRVVNVKVPLK